MVQAASIFSRPSESRRKLYLIVRADLPIGLQAAQAVHAQREFVHDYAEQEGEWYKESNTVVILNAENIDGLKALATKAIEQGIPCSAFCEIDLDNSLTAIALGWQAKKLVSSLPLAFKQKPELKMVG
jgi:peptidyl-tRNA hydrolase